MFEDKERGEMTKEQRIENLIKRDFIDKTKYEDIALRKFDVLPKLKGIEIGILLPRGHVGSLYFEYKKGRFTYLIYYYEKYNKVRSKVISADFLYEEK
jgi:hypothetical protein